MQPRHENALRHHRSALNVGPVRHHGAEEVDKLVRGVPVAHHGIGPHQHAQLSVGTFHPHENRKRRIYTICHSSGGKQPSQQLIFHRIVQVAREAVVQVLRADYKGSPAAYNFLATVRVPPTLHLLAVGLAWSLVHRTPGYTGASSCRYRGGRPSATDQAHATSEAIRRWADCSP